MQVTDCEHIKTKEIDRTCLLSIYRRQSSMSVKNSTKSLNSEKTVQGCPEQAVELNDGWKIDDGFDDWVESFNLPWKQISRYQKSIRARSISRRTQFIQLCYQKSDKKTIEFVLTFAVSWIFILLQSSWNGIKVQNREDWHKEIDFLIS